MTEKTIDIRPVQLDQPDSATLITCADELIRTPGTIQPHGALLVLRQRDLSVIAVSENIAAFLGVEATALLGEPLAHPAFANQMSLVRSRLLAGEQLVSLEINTDAELERRFDVSVVFDSGRQTLLVEIDNPKRTDVATDSPHLGLPRIQQLISGIGLPDSLNGLCEAIVREVRELTGFDRVMVYRFHEDQHGEVIAEDEASGDQRYLGLHFPESDIPVQARELYCLNRIRCITTSSYTPVPIMTLPGLLTDSALDLSHAKLRSVSPIHLEYLQNMGVGASMSLSLMDGDRLWGMVACHNNGEHFVDSETRIVCELLSTTFSLMLLQIEALEADRDILERQKIERQLLSQMARSKPFVGGAFNHLPNLSNLVDADGSASISGETITTIGLAPSTAHIIQLVQWLAEHQTDAVYAHSHLLADYPPAADWDHQICGVMAIEIARSRHQYLLCFRSELTQSIEWAGNPSKNVTRSLDTNRLSPRISFDSWTETIRGHSKPWSKTAIDIATTMRKATLYLIVDWSEQVADLNRQLAKSNSDLQTFAEFAAHDLKEPLRGIHNQISFLISDYGDEISSGVRERLDKIENLADRGHALTSALLRFAELGMQALTVESVDLDSVCAEAIAVFSEETKRLGIDIRIPDPLPTAHCDPVLIGQVFQNLIGNAIKYASEDSPYIEIRYQVHFPAPVGWDEPDEPDTRQYLISIADNGIGIAEEHKEKVFRLFTRLHPRHRYGGGNGIGLGIARRIVELHKGRLWLESIKGEGSTFFFTVGDADV